MLVAVGLCAVGLGVLGIFIPLLPTVPLLLLAAACFARSSDRFHTWLLGHPRLGPVIHCFWEGGGIPRRTKLKAIVMVWFSLLLSLYWVWGNKWGGAVLLIVGFFLTVYLIRLPVAGLLDSETE